MNSQNVAEIEKVIINHTKSYLVENFLSSIMGESEKTEVAINDVLSKKGTHVKIQELLPNVDAAFIRKMIAILSINSDFCEAMNNLGVPKDEIERTITIKLKEGLAE